MAFPDDVLTKDEHVVLHMHPHWKEAIRPAFVLVVALAAIIAGFVLLPSGTGGMIALYVIAAAALVLVLWQTLWPILLWRTTHHVFTNERVILQHGVFSRDRRDIPLGRVNDHSMSQTFIERMLGCGTLTIESAGERGQAVLRDMPQVEKVQTTLYELIEVNNDKHSLGDEEMRQIMKETQQ